MLCIYCGRFSDALLCHHCSHELKKQSFEMRYQERCPVCGHPLQDRAYPCLFCTEGLQAYASYTGIVSTLLNQFKAREEKRVATLLAPLYLPMLHTIENPLLIPVPASRRGYSDRGFDQMLLMCNILRRDAGYPYLRLFAQKGKGQSKFLSRSERQQRHTLSLLPKDKQVATYQKKGATFVLMDDICTTGSTLATSRALLLERYGQQALALVVALV